MAKLVRSVVRPTFSLLMVLFFWCGCGGGTRTTLDAGMTDTAASETPADFPTGPSYDASLVVDGSTSVDHPSESADTALPSAPGDADDGGASDEGFDFVDPVAGSEGDTTLTGTDGDGNGVRDDVDAYIVTLESDARKQTALVSFARESTAMMVLGGAAGTTKIAAVAQAQRVGRTIDCLHDLYSPDLATKQAILQNLRSALYDNAMRLRAYNHASTLLSGTIMRAGRGCDTAITGVSQ